MSSPVDDETAGEPDDGRAATAGDPAPSYPRGNRLGLRHPRPTVVIVLAVLIALAGAFVWKAVAPAEGRLCGLAGLPGAPTAPSPEEAVQAWLDGGQQPGTETRYGAFPAPTSVDQFT